MDRKLVAELERLLSELADEGATQQRVERIENLLLDNPELQDHYWSWMDVHVVLGTDRAAILGESTTAGPLSCLESVERPLNTPASVAASPAKYSYWWLAPALAVAACLAWLLLPGGVTWQRLVGELHPAMAEAGEPDAWRIPKITRVSWEGPYFAEPDQSHDSQVGAHVGLVSLGYVDNVPANGYVLRLEPGMSAELMMAADAYSENNLSVTELNATGTPIRRSVSFNNFGSGATPPFGTFDVRNRRYGLIGTWSEFNDTGKPKYYLINGIHKSTDPNSATLHAEQEFQLSKMVVTLDEPDLILLGWDDSGIDPTEVSAGVEPDGDYDDISVLIRLSGKGVDVPPTSGDRRVVDVSFSAAEPPRTDGEDRYRFTLRPGEIAVLKVASECRKTNSMYFVCEDSGDILWSAQNTKPGTMNLGAVGVQNTSDRNMNLAIFGENERLLENGEVEWQGSTMATIHHQPGCSIVGFEDNGPTGDFDDIRLTLLLMSPNRSTSFGDQ